MYSTKAAITKATAFANECIRHGLQVEKAILFGSHAKRSQHKWSDIDVALVSKQFTFNFIQNNHLTFKANMLHPDVEVHHFTIEDFTEENPFVEEIIKTGISLNLDTKLKKAA